MSLKKVQALPEQEYLNDIFDYNPETGEVVRRFVDYSVMTKWGWTETRVKVWNTAYAGEIAGHVFKSTSGSVLTQVRVDGKSYYLPRIIWKMVTGEDPEIIDHIDGNPQNNRWVNFRDVSTRENSKNVKRFCTNTSGVTGVSWCKSSKKWFAYIWKDYKRISLGRHSDFEEAVRVRKEAEILYGYHENHGRD